MKIFQVQNEAGNPASREGNEEAIFLSTEKAQEHINFLHDECGLKNMKFEIVELSKVSINKAYELKKIGEQIKKARKEKGLSLNQLSKDLYETRGRVNHLSDIEKGKVDLSTTQLILITRYLGIKPF